MAKAKEAKEGISYNELSNIKNNLEKAQKAKSSKVEYARTKNIRQITEQLTDWEKANMSEQLSEFIKKRNELLIELANKENIAIQGSESIQLVLSRLSEKRRKEYFDRHTKLYTKEIQKLNEDYTQAQNKPDMELDLFKVKLSDFPEDYADTGLFYDIIEEEP